jgi:hypothetical protein
VTTQPSGFTGARIYPPPQVIEQKGRLQPEEELKTKDDPADIDDDIED